MNQEQERNGNEIAVIGMAGRFPGAANLDEYWRNLRDGVESVREYQPDELRGLGVDEQVILDPDYIPMAAELQDRDFFDAEFFRFPPAEAERLSPQHRVFLECAWHALEDAGIDPFRYQASIGLYCGAGMNTYMLFNRLHHEITGRNPFPAYFANGHDFLATRVAYKLNLRGPAITVQTACSTSLTAIHLACQSILNGECETALAGGVGIITHPRPGYFHMEGGTLSPDGHCRAFDAKAGGTIPGSGAGVVVLKSLEDALNDGDEIQAIIRGSAINNDGSDKMGYTAPSARGQASVVREALGVADVEAESIGYIETHGTGTVLGDPIEIAALRSVFPASTSGDAYCALGSVKTNIGHLDAAAGVAGFIKTVLSLRREKIPPSLNCDELNPELQLEGSPFFVNTQSRAWEKGDTPRRAGISGFGIGGTNVHIILQEAPPGTTSHASPPTDGDGDAKPSPSPNGKREILFLSARSPDALDAMCDNLAGHLDEHSELDSADIANVLNTRHSIFEHRRAIIHESLSEAVTLLRERSSPRVLNEFSETMDASVVFMFPGQGVQYPNMGRGLYLGETVFRYTLDECAEILRPLMGLDIRELLFHDADAAATERLRRTEHLQPVLFSFEYALARLWTAQGVLPRAMIGHSLGEYTAACLSGVFSLPDALTAVCARGRLMGELPGGGMLAAASDRDSLTDILNGEIAVAAENQTDRTVLAGPTQELERAREMLRERNIDFREVATSHAFHSSMMEPAMEPFRKVLEKITLHEPKIPFVSNVTGDWIDAAQACDADYWVRQMREPVRFASGLRTLANMSNIIPLECGPGRTLSSFAKHGGDFNSVIHCLSDEREVNEDQETFAEALARMRLAGVKFEDSSTPRNPVVRLPPYPFQRKLFRLPDADGPRAGENGGRTAGRFGGPGDGLLHLPTWIRKPFSPTAVSDEPILIIADAASSQMADDLQTRLKKENHPVVTVHSGTNFQETELNFTFDDEGLTALFHSLDAQGINPTRMVLMFGSREAGEMGLDGEMDAQLEKFLEFPLGLIRRLGENPSEHKRELIFVADGIFDVLGNEEPNPWAALLLGPTLVAPSEYPDLRCRLLDVPASSPENLYREVCARNPDDIVALRGPHRWVRRVEAAGMPAPGDFQLRQNGVYMIIGGTGGIGLELAEHLAREGAGHLALVSRSGPNAEGTEHIAQKLNKIREHGTRVSLHKGDAREKETLRDIVQRIESEAGPIAGVVHSAGEPAGGIIQLKTREAMREVLAPRVLGALVLDEIFRGKRLDFMVYCSSVSAISGGFGQSDYAAANAFLDSFANFRARDTDQRTLSINWDAWRETGMAVRGPEQSFKTPRINSANFPGEIVHRDESRIEFAGTLATADNWFLDEHRLGGIPLVPGTAYVQAIHRAMRGFLGPTGAVKFQELSFLTPLFVPEGQVHELRVHIQRNGETFNCRIESRGPDETKSRPHATARTEIVDAAISQPRKNPAEILERLRLDEKTETKSMGDLAEYMSRSRGVELGPRWQCLREIHFGPGESLAKLTLPAEYAKDLENQSLHPALLDAATGFDHLRGHEFYLPLSYVDAVVHAPLTPELISSAIRVGGTGETLVYKITIMDPEGRILVEIGEFTLRRVEKREEVIPQVKNKATVPEQVRMGTELGLSSAMGKKAFESALAMGVSQVIVTTRDPNEAISHAPSSAGNDIERKAHGRPNLRVAYAAPMGDSETIMENLWSDLLRIESIGRNDNFFELGGDSLLAIQLIPGARKAGLALTPGLIFEKPTIAELTAAALTRDDRHEEQETADTATPDSGELRNALLEVEFE